MNRVTFINSHIGSKFSELIHQLNQNELFSVQTTHSLYTHPDDLDWLFSTHHTCKNSAAIYGDIILNNSSIRCKALLDIVYMINFITKPSLALPRIIDAFSEPYATQRAVDYYQSRIQRIKEISVKSINKILLTESSFSKPEFTSAINNMFNTNVSLNPIEIDSVEFNVKSSLIQSCNNSYENCLYVCKKNNVLVV